MTEQAQAVYSTVCCKAARLVGQITVLYSTVKAVKVFRAHAVENDRTSNARKRMHTQNAITCHEIA